MGRIDKRAFNEAMAGIDGAVTYPEPAKRSPTTGDQMRRTRLNPVNKVRAAYRRSENFGEHADWVRTLPCVACFPVLYDGDDLKPVLKLEGFAPISDPMHVTSRGAGGKADQIVPGCRHHHNESDSPGWGIETFQAVYKLDLERIARLLWEVSPAREQ